MIACFLRAIRKCMLCVLVKITVAIIFWCWKSLCLCLSLFCYALLCVHSSFAIPWRGRESWLLCYYCLTIYVLWLFLNLRLSSWCLVTVIVLWPFLMVPWVSLQCVIVIFPDHTHFFIYGYLANIKQNGFSRQFFVVERIFRWFLATYCHKYNTYFLICSFSFKYRSVLLFNPEEFLYALKIYI